MKSTPLMCLHGVVFTAWVVLFIVPTALVRARRVAVHQQLGVTGLVLAVIVVVGLQTTNRGGGERVGGAAVAKRTSG